MSSRKMILRKTIEVGSSTLLSRFLGIAREVLQVRYLGVGPISDAFLAAFKIPNSLRKIFAEGALSAALIPTVVSVEKHESKEGVSSLISLAFLLFEGVLFLLCLFMFFNADLVISWVAPGFSPEVRAYAGPYLQILMPLILLISSSAVLAGVLQSSHHFLIPALAPVLLNVFYIIGLFLGIYFGFSVTSLCYIILLGSAVNFILHLITYFNFGYHFGAINRRAVANLFKLLSSFLPFMLSMSVMEINFFVDTIFASFLPTGSVTLVYYGGRLMAIPLGVFAIAFSTILLPHFSRVSLYAPKRLNFYLFEATKFICWVTVPATILLAYFAEDIYRTIFVSSKFPVTLVPEAGWILIAFLAGLTAFSVNKILLNLYYALHDRQAPTWSSVIATITNALGNYLLMSWLGAPGLALATSFSAIFQMSFLIYYLHHYYHFKLYTAQFGAFILRFGVQALVISGLVITAHLLIGQLLLYLAPVGLHHFLFDSIGFWFWVGPIIAGGALIMFLTRRFFGYRMHFLD